MNCYPANIPLMPTMALKWRVPQGHALMLTFAILKCGVAGAITLDARLYAPPVLVERFRLSNDGALAAIVEQQYGSNIKSLLLLNLKDGTTTNLLSEERRMDNLTFAPDDGRLAFTQYNAAKRQVWKNCRTAWRSDVEARSIVRTRG